MNQIETALICQRRRALAVQRMRSFKKLLKHFRNLFLVEVKERSEYS